MSLYQVALSKSRASPIQDIISDHGGFVIDDEVTICRAKSAKDQKEYDCNYEKERAVIEG